jgi:hypothetical protein
VWLWLDRCRAPQVSILPFDIVGFMMNQGSVSQLKVLRIIRLLRLMKLVRIAKASRYRPCTLL